MMEIIQFLQANLSQLELLKQGKLSLVGVSKSETKAILEAFEEDLHQKGAFWF